MRDRLYPILVCVVILMVLVFGILSIAAMSQEHPGITACAHESHAHQDEDLRIRMQVRITGSDACGFGWETEHEVGRLEFDPKTAVSTTQLLPTGGNTTIITVRDVRKGRTALVVFCSFCKSAIYVGLNTEVKK